MLRACIWPPDRRKEGDVASEGKRWESGQDWILEVEV